MFAQLREKAGVKGPESRRKRQTGGVMWRTEISLQAGVYRHVGSGSGPGRGIDTEYVQAARKPKYKALGLSSDSEEIQFVSLIRSERQRVRAVISKWSDQIFRSRHIQQIFRGCYGNDVGFSNFVSWWRSFPTLKRDPSSRSAVEQTVYFSVTPQTVFLRVVFHTALLVAAWSPTQLLWCNSVSLDLMTPLYSALQVTQRRLIVRYKRPVGVDWYGFFRAKY